MAMSHPAFLNQAERPQVHFGSHSQFQVKRAGIYFNLQVKGLALTPGSW
jgi:hypothetical protein